MFSLVAMAMLEKKQEFGWKGEGHHNFTGLTDQSLTDLENGSSLKGAHVYKSWAQSGTEAALLQTTRDAAQYAHGLQQKAQGSITQHYTFISSDSVKADTSRDKLWFHETAFACSSVMQFYHGGASKTCPRFSSLNVRTPVMHTETVLKMLGRSRANMHLSSSAQSCFLVAGGED